MSKVAKFLDLMCPPPKPSPTLEVIEEYPTLPTAAGDLKTYPLPGSDIYTLYTVRLGSLRRSPGSLH